METDRLTHLKKVAFTFQKTGYMVSQRHGMRSSCFDLAARKQSHLVLLKILLNIDNFHEIHAKELALFSLLFSASPLIIGERTRKALVEDGVVYERFSIPVVNYFTLTRILYERLLPLIYAKRGGLYANIDGERLKKARESEDLSLGDVAELIGVSRKAVYEYERSNMNSTIATALRLEEVFDIPLTVPLDIFSWMIKHKESIEKELHQPILDSALERLVQKTLLQLGLRVLWTKSAPFNAVAEKEKDVLITGVGSAKEKGIEERIGVMGSVSKVVDRNVMFVMEGKCDAPNIGGVPVIRRKELKQIEKPKKLFEVIEERS